MNDQLKTFLEKKVAEYNTPAFIANDPVCIPHRFNQQQDIEIAALFAAVFAWGNRKIIIDKCTELMQRMGNQPFAFVQQHSNNDLKQLLGFKHRTFNDTDLLYFVHFLKEHYSAHASLESAFSNGLNKSSATIESALNYFFNYFFSFDAPLRTRKHIAAPFKKSTCKRLCMFLRWMVRRDKCGVDFGIWRNIKPAQLICPIDVHVARVAYRFNLLSRKNVDWLAALELTASLRQLNTADPARYDFALFALGVVEKF